ncbi:MAG: Ldh family oxidoreductase [Hyphomicrobiaceae bacterium]
MTTRNLSLDDVEDIAFRALTGAGTSEPAARAVARSTRAAEYDGIRSHGLHYVPIYAEHVQCGKVDGKAEPVVTRPKPAAITVDAASGFAHPAIEAGFEILRDAVREQGAIVMTVKNSYNCGVLGYHVERLAEAGLLGIGFTNAPASIAPSGGTKAVVGTNPFALGVPAATPGDAAFIIDQSSSAIAKSEIALRAREGESIPEGWALDADGNPTTDPNVALKGTMVPSGGYKGFGVGLLVEVLAAGLSGATLGIHASPFAGTVGGPPRTGQCFIAMDPDTFSDNTFAERITGLCAAIEAQDGTRLPGAKKKAARATTKANGVDVDEALLTRIEAFIA